LTWGILSLFLFSQPIWALGRGHSQETESSGKHSSKKHSKKGSKKKKKKKSKKGSKGSGKEAGAGFNLESQVTNKGDLTFSFKDEEGKKPEKKNSTEDSE